MGAGNDSIAVFSQPAIAPPTGSIIDESGSIPRGGPTGT